MANNGSLPINLADFRKQQSKLRRPHLTWHHIEKFTFIILNNYEQ